MEKEWTKAEFFVSKSKRKVSKYWSKLARSELSIQFFWVASKIHKPKKSLEYKTESLRPNTKIETCTAKEKKI